MELPEVLGSSSNMDEKNYKKVQIASLKLKVEGTCPYLNHRQPNFCVSSSKWVPNFGSFLISVRREVQL